MVNHSLRTSAFQAVLRNNFREGGPRGFQRLWREAHSDLIKNSSTVLAVSVRSCLISFDKKFPQLRQTGKQKLLQASGPLKGFLLLVRSKSMLEKKPSVL